MPLTDISYDPEGILDELKGRQKIHVGRKVIVASLKQTTNALSVLLKDSVEKEKLVKTLTESNRALLKISRKLQSKMDEMTETLAEQSKILKQHDDVIGSGKIEEALAKIDVIESRQLKLEEQLGIAFNNIEETETRLRSELTSKDDAMGTRVDNVLDFANRIDERMHHTEDRWRNLGVDTDRGYRLNSMKVVYGEDQQSLEEVVTKMRAETTDALGGLELTLNNHQTMLKKFEPKVKLVPKIRDIARQNHDMLKSLGVGEGDGQSLLEQIQTLRASVSTNARGLLEKADAKKITEVIETKYDEIVGHLQVAISSACDEEDEFKRVAEELRGMVKDLMLNKADRADLLRMSERIAADKAIREDVSVMKLQLADLVGRKELSEMLKDKLSRDDGIEVIERHSKKLGRRINAMLSSVMGITQQIAESKTIKNAKVVGKGVGDETKKSVVNEYTHSDVRFRKGADGDIDDIDGKYHHSSEDTPVMGPGSSSLGGGFRVMLSTDRSHHGGSSSPEKLPNIRGASR
jgi:hypothetical protein